MLQHPELARAYWWHVVLRTVSEVIIIENVSSGHYNKFWTGSRKELANMLFASKGATAVVGEENPIELSREKSPIYERSGEWRSSFGIIRFILLSWRMHGSIPRWGRKCLTHLTPKPLPNKPSMAVTLWWYPALNFLASHVPLSPSKTPDCPGYRFGTKLKSETIPRCSLSIVTLPKTNLYLFEGRLHVGPILSVRLLGVWTLRMLVLAVPESSRLFRLKATGKNLPVVAYVRIR